MKKPTFIKDSLAFLGLVGCYLKFIPGFRKMAGLLYKLINKSNKFVCTECKKAVTELNKKLLKAPVLGYPNMRDPYTLSTNASLTGIGTILTQKQGTEDRVVSYAIKSLSKN